ncbi:hypothetical protein PVAND_016694 [Polypedilum vanderplanki]|uniref:Glycosyltransferase 2-like domain-containing protein n=1 Tax=Polypedilum vanderplanki TaxID=319348 RepID=A0A9J6BGP9_POLVA|nr:hypothetical protein PVAND_016694 [Polypedilum vanderplanki]
MITIKSSMIGEQLRKENFFMRTKIESLLMQGLQKREKSIKEIKKDEIAAELNLNDVENMIEEPEIMEDELNEESSKEIFVLDDGITEEAKNYIKILNLTNPGANGEAVILPSNLPPEIKKKIDEGYETYGFNAFVSSLISLNRDFPDIRSDYCKTKVYRKDLPKASVIIPFHDDDWSLLMRTVHSIIRYSPPELIEEIILVDDYSQREHLKDHLDEYVKKLPKVKVVRSHQRLGIVANRVLAARNALAPILVYVDSHVECGPGWLEPILDRLKDNENLLVWGKISVIDDDTLFLSLDNKTGGIGGFTWSMDFSWIDVKFYEGDNPTPTYEPKASPTFMGPTYALWRHWFEKIGYFDTDMDIWGGEDVELGFRMWMCHGRVEMIPCAVVAHMYRGHTYTMHSEDKGGYRWNTDRIAETWLGEYLRYYYRLVGDTKNRNFGDISERLAIKKKLKCHDFKWFIENVHPKQTIPEKIRDPTTTTAIQMKPQKDEEKIIDKKNNLNKI